MPSHDVTNSAADVIATTEPDVNPYDDTTLGEIAQVALDALGTATPATASHSGNPTRVMREAEYKIAEAALTKLINSL